MSCQFNLECIDKQAHSKLMPERAARNRANGQYCSLGTATIIFSSTVRSDGDQAGVSTARIDCEAAFDHAQDLSGMRSPSEL
jgi:hypothetical protein